MKNSKLLYSIIAIVLVSIFLLIGITLYKDNTMDASPTISTADSAATNTQADNSESKEPEKPLIIIDPGHGGWEPGAGNGSINEKDVVLGISLEVEKELIEKEINYFMIRNDDTYYSLEDRTRIANEKKASLFISIHNNSFTDPSQSGILTAYNPYSEVGKDIAQIMQSKLGDIGMRNRNIVSRPNLYVLRHTEMPSLLLEVGFISNNKDLKLITASDFQQKCAKQIVLGIEEILEKHISTNSSTGEEGIPLEE